MSLARYSQAVNTYQRKSDENLSPLQIVVELYKAMLRNTREARRAFENGQLDVMSNHISKVFNIIEALQVNLDLEQGGEDAAFLNRFYNVIFAALGNATAKVDPAKEFDAILSYIQDVHDRFYTMAYGRPAETEADSL